MRKGLIFILMVTSFGVMAQNRFSYDKAVREANQFLNDGNYINAYLKFQAAEISARENKITSKQADEGLEKALTLIKAEHDASNAYRKEKENYEYQLRQLSGSISKLRDLVQDETNNKIMGFSLLRNKLLNVLVNAQSLTSSNSTPSVENGIIRSHLHLASTNEEMGNSETAISENNQAYLIAKKVMDELTLKKKPVPSDILTSYLKTLAARLINLTNLNEMSNVGIVLSESKIYVNSIGIATADNFDALASFEDAYSIYKKLTNDVEGAASLRKRAIDHERTAITLDITNPFYYNALINYLHSAALDVLTNKSSPDSVSKYEVESDRILRTWTNAPGSAGLFFKNKIITTERWSRRHVNLQQYQSALDTLGRAVDQVGEFIRLNPNQSDYNLIRAGLYTEIASIYFLKLNDARKQKVYLDLAIEDFIRLFNGKKILPPDLVLLMNTYRDIENNLVDITDGIENSSKVNSLLKAVTPAGSEFYSVPSIAYIAATLNLSNAEFLLKNKTKPDSTAALTYLNRAVFFFGNVKKTNSVETYNGMETKFCTALSKRFEIDVKNEKKELMSAEYTELIKICYPIYRKFDYDFNVGWMLANVNRLYGAYLIKRGRYQAAIPPLSFASMEGMKSGTAGLIKIYSSNGLKDAAKLRFFLKRANEQSNDERKEYFIEALLDNAKIKYPLYVADRAQEHPYKGIDDQVKWALVTRNIVIDTNYTCKLARAQQSAWLGDKPFQTISSSTMDEANNAINVLNKYIKYKRNIEIAKNVDKLALSGDLYQVYETDLKRRPEYFEVIKSDAISFYLKYVDLLIAYQDKTGARDICERLLELDSTNLAAKNRLMKVYYLENKNNITKSDYANDTEHLKFFLSEYLKESETKKAEVVVNKLLALRDDAKMRDDIGIIYQITWGNNFDKLFLNNKKRVKEYLTYFLSKEQGKMISDDVKRNHFFQIMLLGDFYLQNNSKADQALNKKLSAAYNDYVWYSLLVQKKGAFMNYLNQSIDLDPANKYPIANKVNLFLVNNEFTNAKNLILKYKDFECDPDNGYPSFKELFLRNFRILQKLDANNANIKEAIKMLNYR